MDRKTVRRYVSAAEGLGLVRDGGEDQLTDGFMGVVVEAVRPHRVDGHGEVWGLLAERPMSVPAPTVTPELKALLRKVKLGRLLDTLPERLALAKTNKLAHAEFLELVLADEVTRRDVSSAALRARDTGPQTGPPRRKRR